MYGGQEGISIFKKSLSRLKFENLELNLPSDFKVFRIYIWGLASIKIKIQKLKPNFSNNNDKINSSRLVHLVTIPSFNLDIRKLKFGLHRV